MGDLTHFSSANSTDPFTDWDMNTINALQDEVRKHIWYQLQKYQAEVQTQLYVSKNLDLGPIKAIQSRMMVLFMGYQQLRATINRIVPELGEGEDE